MTSTRGQVSALYLVMGMVIVLCAGSLGGCVQLALKPDFRQGQTQAIGTPPRSQSHHAARGLFLTWRKPL